MSVKRYTIYYNERERDMYVAESQDGKYCLHSDYAAIRSRVARLEEAGKNILRKIPKTKNDCSGVGYCFGCGVVKWASGQGNYSEECKPGCALQEFRRALEEK